VGPFWEFNLDYCLKLIHPIELNKDRLEGHQSQLNMFIIYV